MENPSPALERDTDIRTVRLVGDADAVAWVAQTLALARFEVESSEDCPADPAGPVIWVARPGPTASGPAAGSPVVSDAAVWSFPTLVVVPPGGAIPDVLSGHPSVESFDVVREPEDGPIVPMRIERLLLLHSRRSQTEVVLHNLSNVVYTRTWDGTLTSINAAGERLFGLPREEMVGRRLGELVPSPDWAEVLIDKTNRELEASGRSRARLALPDRRGRLRVFDREALFLRDGHGSPCGLQVILTDVTEEQEARDRLRLEAERNDVLASIASAARDSLDLDEVLDAASELLGTRLNANGIQIWFLDGTRTTCRVALHWRRSPEIPSLVGFERSVAESPVVHLLVETGEPWVVADTARLDPASLEARTLARIGARSVAAVPIRHEQEMIGTIGISWSEPRPISGDDLVFFGRVADQLALAIRAARLYRNLQNKVEALAEAQRRREEADRDRQQLTAMLVHDLKNPLSAISAALDLTREKVLASGDGRFLRMLDASMSSARGLQGLIEDVLLVYRPQDAPEPERVLVPPAEALAQPLEEARWLAEARRVSLEVRLAEGLPLVSLDVPRFRRAAANLLGNAIKFTPPGGTVCVDADLETKPDGRHFVLRIADSGPGIPETERDRIANPWVRLSVAPEVPGHGLGLTVVLRVAQAHGGRLETGRNEGGGGAVFSLLIPA